MTSKEYVKLCLARLEDDNFDEESWECLFREIVIFNKNKVSLYGEERKTVVCKILSSSSANTSTVMTYASVLFIQDEICWAFGQNPLFSLWLENGIDDMEWICLSAIGGTLDRWIKEVFEAMTIEPQVFKNLFDMVHQEKWSLVFLNIDSFRADNFVEFISEAVANFNDSGESENLIEHAKSCHKLLVALCQACNVSVPKNIFSIFEDP